MSFDKLLVLAISVFGMSFTYWFFLMKKERVVSITSDSVEIIVNGGYQPEVISIAKGKTTTINFLRTDSNNCLEEVILPDFKTRKFLPLNKKVSISVLPKQAGEYEIVCGMNMFHGKILVN